MPRASGMPGHQVPIVERPYYNLVFGTEPDEEVMDSLVDTLDLVTPRDLSAARFARNHELFDQVFGPSRLGTHTKELEEKLASAQNEVAELEKAHAERMAQWRSDASDKPAADELAEWERAPSEGPILGVGHVRASPPPEYAALRGAPRAPSQPTPPDAATHEAIARINQAHGVDGTATGVAVPTEAVPAHAEPAAASSHGNEGQKSEEPSQKEETVRGS